MSVTLERVPTLGDVTCPLGWTTQEATIDVGPSKKRTIKVGEIYDVNELIYPTYFAQKQPTQALLYALTPSNSKLSLHAKFAWYDRDRRLQLDEFLLSIF